MGNAFRKSLLLSLAVFAISAGMMFATEIAKAQDTLCGSSNGGFFTSQPTSGLCLPGATFGGIFSGQGEWTWYCHGAVASYQCHGWIDARCGTSNGGTFDVFPSGNLCSSGSSVSLGQEGSYWKWECRSYTGTAFSPAPPNDVESCQANVATPRIYPSCGNSNGGSFSSEPTNGLCATGNLKSSPTLSGNTWNWICEEEPRIVISPSPSLEVAYCSAMRTVTPPSCGSANGGEFRTTPTNNLCSSGSVGNGPIRSGSSWTWNCTTESGSIGCSAHWQPTAPVCGSTNGSWFTTAPTNNLCSIGTPGTVSQSTVSGNPSWNWDCSNDGITRDCNAWIQPTCGSANGRQQSEKPTTGLCATGNSTPVSENSEGGWSWDCINNANVSHGVNCHTTPVPPSTPVCGNGTIETGEECDDGNRNDKDGCDSLCKKETPITPPTPPEQPKKEDGEDDKDCDASIGDVVWNDLNKNGSQDNGEGGIPRITIKLLNGDRVEKDATNDEGKYSFKNLCKGSYRVMVDANDIREGCYPTYDRDRDLDHSTTAKVTHDEKYRDADFGYYCPTAPRTGSGAVALAIAATVAGLIVIFGRRFLRLKTK